MTGDRDGPVRSGDHAPRRRRCHRPSTDTVTPERYIQGVRREPRPEGPLRIAGLAAPAPQSAAGRSSNPTASILR